MNIRFALTLLYVHESAVERMKKKKNVELLSLPQLGSFAHHTLSLCSKGAMSIERVLISDIFPARSLSIRCTCI